MENETLPQRNNPLKFSITKKEEFTNRNQYLKFMKFLFSDKALNTLYVNIKT